MAVVAYSPVESTRPGYFVIPGFTRYGVSVDGGVINIRTGHLKTFYTVKGYPATTVMSDSEGVMKWMFLHRLVALAFHGPEPEGLPLVNHRDNTKTNCHPDNLEWTDHTGNILHAYQTGQRTDNRPVLAKNLLTGQITRFYSANECARHFGVTGERIWRNIRDNTGNIYFNSYVFRFEDDERPWPDLTDEDVGKVNNGDPKAVTAKRISDGAEFRAASVSDMAKQTGVKFATVAYALRTGRQYPCFGYLFKLENDPSPWIQ